MRKLKHSRAHEQKENLNQADFHDLHRRSVKMHNLWEYTRTRRSLLSKRVYLLVSAAGEKSEDGGELNRPTYES